MPDSLDPTFEALRGLQTAVGVFDSAGDLRWATRSYLAILGWDETYLGRNILTLGDPAQNVAFYSAFEAVQSGEPQRQVRNESGDYHRVFDSTISRSGNSIIVEFTDATAQVEAEGRERLMVGSIETVFRSTNDVIIIADFVDGTVRTNEAAHRYYGDLDWLSAALQRDDVDVTALPTDAFPFEDPGATMADELALVARVWESGEAQHVIGPIATLLGSRVMDRTLSRWDVDETPRGIIIVKSDVTDLLDEQASNERLRARLDYGRRMQRFAQGMAHDLGNVAQVVDGYAQILAANPSPETATTAARGLAGAAARSVAVSRRIATIARLDQVRNGTLDLAPLVRERVGTITARMPGGIELHCTTPPQAAVHANPEQITSALDTLVDNAVHALQGRGRIDISVDMSADQVTMEVRDNGPGIPADVADRLFEPFVSGHESRGAGGTGLSLFLLREYVQSIGGDISCESGPDGARFRLRMLRA